LFSQSHKTTSRIMGLLQLGSNSVYVNVYL